MTSWSHYQDAIFSSISSTVDNLMIEAVAGSGKTSTLEESSKRLPYSPLCIAFNKPIQLEMKARGLNAVTFNGLGHKMYISKYRSAILDKSKDWKIANETFGSESQLMKDFGSAVVRGVTLAKANAWRPEDSDALAFEELIDSYDLDVPSSELRSVAEASWQLFQRSSQMRDIFDFNDQLWVPVYENFQFPTYMGVLVDELQDANALQHEALRRMRSRVCGFGDRAQSIYGFRGALHSSMDDFKRDFKATELPLSITYRCSRAVVREAQKYCPQIEAAPDAQEGVIHHLDTDPEIFPSDILILCRTNAPLFGAILRHIRRGKPVQCRSQFLDNFQKFIHKFGCESTKDLMVKLEAWRIEEVSAAKAKGFQGKIAAVQDKFETIKQFCDQYKTVSEILYVLRKLADSETGPIFSTIHKAKGLEAERVYILRPDLMPAKWVFGEAAERQERNILYVAITRAKRELTFGEIR
jgi:DNA helicase-2/ATP-dependent DNA helicase PcrA